MPRKKKVAAPPSQTELLDITAKLRTGPCVPALREAVKAWKAGGYKGVTDTTRSFAEPLVLYRSSDSDRVALQVSRFSAGSD